MSLIGVTVFTGFGMGWSVVRPGVVAAAAAQGYRVEEFIDFRKGGNAKPYLRDGWGITGEEGTITAAPVANLEIPVELLGKTGFKFEAVGRPRFAAEETDYWVEVLANGVPIAQWAFSRENPAPRRDLAAIPHDFAKVASPLRITFVVGADHPASRRAIKAGFTGYELEMLRLTAP